MSTVRVYQSRGKLQRFANGTRYRRVQTLCCRAGCRRAITVLVASHQDLDTMRRHSLCLSCEGRTPAEKFVDMTPHDRRRARP